MNKLLWVIYVGLGIMGVIFIAYGVTGYETNKSTSKGIMDRRSK
jgi:hypothetical protein